MIPHLTATDLRPRVLTELSTLSWDDGGKPADCQRPAALGAAAPVGAPEEVATLLARLDLLAPAELEREAKKLSQSSIRSLVDAPGSAAIARLLRHRFTAVARTFENDLYFAGAATVSIDDADRDGEPDFIPEPTYRRTSDFLFGLFGKKTHTDDFALWMRREGPKPGRRGKMNCWEAVFLLAHEAGLLSEIRLRGIYDNAARVGREAGSQAAYFRALGDALGLDRADPARAPQAGDIVFFQSDLGYGGMEHVALALGTFDARGRREILSLWQLPAGALGFKSRLQKTTIEELIEHAARYGLQLEAKVAPMPFGARPASRCARAQPTAPATHTGLAAPRPSLAGVVTGAPGSAAAH